MRPSKVMANALRAGFHLIAHSGRPSSSAAASTAPGIACPRAGLWQDPASIGPRRAHQPVRSRSLKPQVRQHGPAFGTRQDPSRRTALADLGLAVVALGEAPSDGVVVDDTGAYRAWLDELQADAVLIRPDFAVYGTAHQGGDVTDLVDGFLTALGHPAPTTSGVANRGRISLIPFAFDLPRGGGLARRRVTCRHGQGGPQ
jgi:hypothetical protein